jgi:glycosyltransferase involved in cell wall biosynthesis
VTWGLPRERIAHVTNGQRDYNAGGRGAGRPGAGNRFGFFGQMVDNKGVWLILEAVAQLRAEGFAAFYIEINGDNLNYASETRRGEIEAFRESERALPLEEQRVSFNGHYEVGQLASRMNRIDWCIVPSVWWETFGLVISEAWMFGKPVIASDIGAMRERIRDGQDGLLFAAGDGRALAAAIKRAVTEPGLRDSLAGQIAPPPSQGAMVAGMLAAYGETPDAKPAAPPVIPTIVNDQGAPPRPRKRGPKLNGQALSLTGR